MRKHTLVGKITIWLGLFYFIFGCFSFLGPIGYSSIAPKQGLAVTYMSLGIAMILSSNFFKKESQ
ncbi:hypothetical protein JOC86_000039 [Bacillus pakistanensis]|uniref:YrhK domain-containing protein n=1 Tax=Rossellomorea pakistanensis TaxID=992288 RepID=A0ABS2N6L9_9BACI|nr:hypothetical protein [Bacillus pakistanensis]MBM7583502.1 hypothetical protein [Bacillus pakistanensis]